MLSSPRKPPSNRFDPSASSRLTHQVKLTSSLSKMLTQEVEVAGPVDGEHLERGPGVNRRVDVAEVPLVGGQCSVGVLEPLAAQQQQLAFGECRVDVCERHGVEGEIPRGEPGVLPFVRHRHDVEGVELAPSGVAPVEPGGRRRRHSRVAVEPAGHVVVVELLAPQHAGECLTHHHRLVGRGAGRGELGVELVGLGPPGRRDLFEIGSQRDPRRPGPPRWDAAAAAAPRSRPARPPPGTTRRTWCPAGRGSPSPRPRRRDR